MMLTRLPDWPERLAAWVEQHQATRFAWGSHDCVSAAASAVEAITGVNPLPELAWSTREEAEQLLAEHGGLRSATTSRLGLPIDAAYAQRGDLVLVDAIDTVDGTSPALAVCLGSICVAPGRLGHAALRMSRATMAWRIGHG